MTNLRSTHPHFVRCLIPNETKTPGLFLCCCFVFFAGLKHSNLLNTLLIIYNVQVLWKTTWSSISWGVMVCWKASESAERASPAESSMVTLSRGDASVRQFKFIAADLCVYINVWEITVAPISSVDTKYWMPVLSQRDSSLTTRKLQRSCWAPLMWTALSTSLDTQRYISTDYVTFELDQSTVLYCMCTYVSFF